MNRQHKSFIEKQNDALLFNDVVGPVIVRVVIPVIAIIAIIIGVNIYNSIKNAKEAATAAEMHEAQMNVLTEYKDTNKKMFGEIEKEWGENGVYYAKTKAGTFEMRFSDERLVAVNYTSVGGVEKQIR